MAHTDKINKTRKIHHSNYALSKAQLCMQKSIQLIYPKDNKEGKKISIFRRSLRSLELLKVWSKKKNPYSDWFLFEIEREIDKLKILLNDIIAESNRLRQKEHARSQIIIKWIQPHKTPPPLKIRLTSPQAYAMLELIVKYDTSEKQCLTLKRCGIAGINEIYTKQINITNKMKNLFNKIIQCEKLIKKYKIEKCTLHKLLNVAVMEAACKEMETEIGEEIPKDVLEGKVRPKFHVDSDPIPVIS